MKKILVILLDFVGFTAGCWIGGELVRMLVSGQAFSPDTNELATSAMLAAFIALFLNISSRKQTAKLDD